MAVGLLSVIGPITALVQPSWSFAMKLYVPAFSPLKTMSL